jgi:phosphatidylglycerophosphate synthase
VSISVIEISAARRRLTLGTLFAIGTGAALLALGVVLIAGRAGFDRRFAMTAAIVYLLGGATLVLRIRAFHPFDRFGLPNAVTLVRLGLSCLFAGLTLEAAFGRPTDEVLWLFVGLAVVALVLDGIDGALARRFAIASRFGARFDMEVDALLIALLSALVFLLDKVGTWVLLIGALRYLFVLFGHVWPALTRPLPASFRRKAISVVQGIALTGLLSPAIESPLSAWIAAGALLLLGYSFAHDVIWLTRRTEAHARGA